MGITRIVLATVLCFVLVNGLGRRGGRRSKNGNRRGSKKIANNKNGNNGGGLVTCPGFAGYCSESYPGDTCLVVCAFGRNNVPVCQETVHQTCLVVCVHSSVPEELTSDPRVWLMAP